MFQAKLKILFLYVLLFVQGCSPFKVFSTDIELQVSAGEVIVYQCESNDQITVRYYSLSDSSLSFVKLHLPNESEITLPNVLSASGVSYSSGSVKWSENNGRASIYIQDKDRQWQPLYMKCKKRSVYNASMNTTGRVTK